MTKKKTTPKKVDPSNNDVKTGGKPKRIYRIYFHQGVELRHWRLGNIHTLNIDSVDHKEVVIHLTPRGFKLTHNNYPGEEIMVFDTNVQYAMAKPE